MKQGAHPFHQQSIDVTSFLQPTDCDRIWIITSPFHIRCLNVCLFTFILPPFYIIILGLEVS